MNEGFRPDEREPSTAENTDLNLSSVMLERNRQKQDLIFFFFWHILDFLTLQLLFLSPARSHIRDFECVHENPQLQSLRRPPQVPLVPPAGSRAPPTAARSAPFPSSSHSHRIQSGTIPDYVSSFCSRLFPNKASLSRGQVLILIRQSRAEECRSEEDWQERLP